MKRGRRHTRTVAGVSFLLLWILPFTPSATELPVHFADGRLKAAVVSALGGSNPDPTPYDMLSLTHLVAHHSGISDLTGIQYATNLVLLHLSGNRIADITPLAKLTKLRNLMLSINQITDISELAELTGLAVLNLDLNQINDISALAAMTGLVTLDLAHRRKSALRHLRVRSKISSQMSGVEAPS